MFFWGMALALSWKGGINHNVSAIKTFFQNCSHEKRVMRL